MALYSNLTVSLSAIRLYGHNLVTLLGFCHFQHLLLGQVASSGHRSCLSNWCFAATDGMGCRASLPISGLSDYTHIQSVVKGYLTGWRSGRIGVWIGQKQSEDFFGWQSNHYVMLNLLGGG